jgi:hypothetical protein
VQRRCPFATAGVGPESAHETAPKCIAVATTRPSSGPTSISIFCPERRHRLGLGCFGMTTAGMAIANRLPPQKIFSQKARI